MRLGNVFVHQPLVGGDVRHTVVAQTTRCNWKLEMAEETSFLVFRSLFLILKRIINI
jgi:hypothetical protein